MGINRFKLNGNTRTQLVFAILSIILLIFAISFYLLNNIQFLSIVLLVLNFLSLIKFNKSIPVFILFFFILIFTFPFLNFSFAAKQISFWPDFLNHDSLIKACFVHFLFVFALFNTITTNISFNEINSITRPSSLISIFLIIICTFILLFSLQGDNIFISGSYSNNSEVTKSPIYEYFIIFFILLRVYLPKYKSFQFFYWGLFIFYVVKTLLYGGRIEVVQIGLVLLFSDFVNSGFMKSANRLFLMLLSLIYMNILLSNIRANPMILFSDEYYQLFDPFANDNDIESSLQGDVVQSTSRIIGMSSLEQVNFKFRAISFLNFLLSPLFISNILGSTSNLAIFKQELYQSGGGGLISGYFYFWLGYFGPIFIGVIIGIIINLYKMNKYIYIYVFSILVTFPRWIAYNPVLIVKFCFFVMVLFYFTEKVILKRSTNR
jgi:hypothetical protein